MPKVLALDPSFTRTGAVTIDTVGMEVCAYRASALIPTKSFQGIQEAIGTIIQQLDPLTEGTTHMIMEGPFPGGNFSRDYSH